MAVINADTLDLAITPGGRVGDASPLGKSGKRRLDDYVREVAHALMREHGFSKSHAIATAKNSLKKWSRGGGKVRPQVRAGAAAHLATQKAIDAGLSEADLAEIIDLAVSTQAVFDLAKLKAAKRKKLKASAFALPEKRGYPIHDRAHARAALRMRGHASPADQKRIVAAVHRRYPDIGLARGPFRYKHGWIKLGGGADEGKLGGGWEIPHKEPEMPTGLLTGKYEVPDVPLPATGRKPKSDGMAPVSVTMRTKQRAADVPGRKRRRRARDNYRTQRAKANRIIATQGMRKGHTPERRSRVEKDYDVGGFRVTGGLSGAFSNIRAACRIIDLAPHWKHGWIPLNAEAVAIKEKMGKGGGHHKAGTFQSPERMKERADRIAAIRDRPLKRPGPPRQGREWNGKYGKKPTPAEVSHTGARPIGDVITERRAKRELDKRYRAHADKIDKYIMDTQAQHPGGVMPEHGTLMPDGTINWSKERTKLHRKLVDAEFRKQKRQGAQRNGHAIFLGGLPGAGKSSGLKKTIGDVESQYVTVNPDIFKERMAHMGIVSKHEGLSPLEASAFHHEESARMAEMLAERAMKHGYNIIHDITMNSEKSVTKRLEPLKKRGYSAEAMFFDIPHSFSTDSVEARHRRGWEKTLTDPTHVGQRYVPSGFRNSGKSKKGSTSANRDAFDAVRSQFDDSKLYHQGTSYEMKLVGKHPR